jgi:glycerophosphoryl diester phosphodiesterase
VVEFDVRAWRGELVLAHTVFHARKGSNVLLHEALAHLAGPEFEGLDLNVDVKHAGFEPTLVEQLRDHGLTERTLISSQVTEVLDRVRELEPELRVGISIGGHVARLSQHWHDWRRQVLAGIGGHRWDAVMAHHKLIDPWLLEDVIEAKGKLYAWTVNQRKGIDELRELGVHGIATSDPRLFTA